jgi:hypothetical protein
MKFVRMAVITVVVGVLAGLSAVNLSDPRGQLRHRAG